MESITLDRGEAHMKVRVCVGGGGLDQRHTSLIIPVKLRIDNVPVLFCWNGSPLVPEAQQTGVHCCCAPSCPPATYDDAHTTCAKV
jgi:hypothetical protein